MMCKFKFEDIIDFGMSNDCKCWIIIINMKKLDDYIVY